MPTTEIAPSPATRFVALDVHRQYLVVGAVDIQQQVVLSPRRFGFAAFTEWASIHLTHADAVVLEATSNAWQLYDQLQPLVAEVVVAHPQAVKLIAAARVKTDKRDTIKLASGLSANLISAVWVPPQEVRELRALVTHRNRLVQQRTQTANRLTACCTGTIWSRPQANRLLPTSGNGGWLWTYRLLRNCGSNRI